MKEILDSLSTSVEKLYQGFVLRDLLGFVLPGSIFLLSVWSLFAPAGSYALCDPDKPLQCFVNLLGEDWKTLQIVAFIGGSYLTALLLQSFHYGLVDLVYRIATNKYQIFYYTKSISQPDITDIPNLSEIPSLMSVGALAPEKALKNLKNEKALSRFQESRAYTERLSVLQMVIGNTVLAGIPFLGLLFKSLDLGWGWTILGVIILLFGYVEHWRLYFVRNFRIGFLINAASKDKDAALSNNENPPEATNRSMPS